MLGKPQFGSLSKDSYDALGFLNTLVDVQKHRKNLAIAYANIALPWIQETLKNVKSLLPASDFNTLKSALKENYIPIIQVMVANQETPGINSSVRYHEAFNTCKPPRQPQYEDATTTSARARAEFNC